MYLNELVNILTAAQTDVRRHRERLRQLMTASQKNDVEVDRNEAAEVERILDDILRELDEAITQRDLGK